VTPFKYDLSLAASIITVWKVSGGHGHPLVGVAECLHLLYFSCLLSSFDWLVQFIYVRD